jgi:hypothetical protein
MIASGSHGPAWPQAGLEQTNIDPKITIEDSRQSSIIPEPQLAPLPPDLGIPA